MIIGKYKANKKVTWNSETELAFEKVKRAIKQCTTLFFPDMNAPIYMHTDASDYGIGIYLFQIIDAKEVPIHFLSKAFTTKGQLR
jgi:hypothetical protein